MGITSFQGMLNQILIKTMIFIIGVVIGLCFIILFDKIPSDTISKASINVKSIVEDVSDISVI